MKKGDYRYCAFGTSWFKAHQRALLYLLTSPIFSKWFRWVLRIHEDVKPSERIVKIEPHSFTVALPDNHFRAEFRTHPKYSKRLYFAFKHFWLTLHFWDWSIADRFVPDLSFGYDTLTAYPDAHTETYTVDGYVHCVKGGDTSWATYRAHAGTFARDDSQTDYVFRHTHAGVGGDQWATLSRSIFLFKTDGLTSSAILDSAVLSLAGYTKADGLSSSPQAVIVSANPSSNTSLTATDYSTLGSTTFSGTVTYANWTTDGTYNDFTLNSSGLANISKTGISKFGCRDYYYDLLGNNPPNVIGGDTGLRAYFAEYTGTSRDPKLVVTYHTYTIYEYVATGGIWATGASVSNHLNNCVGAGALYLDGIADIDVAGFFIGNGSIYPTGSAGFQWVKNFENGIEEATGEEPDQNGHIYIGRYAEGYNYVAPHSFVKCETGSGAIYINGTCAVAPSVIVGSGATWIDGSATIAIVCAYTGTDGPMIDGTCRLDIRYTGDGAAYLGGSGGVACEQVYVNEENDQIGYNKSLYWVHDPDEAVTASLVLIRCPNGDGGPYLDGIADQYYLNGLRQTYEPEVSGGTFVSGAVECFFEAYPVAGGCIYLAGGYIFEMTVIGSGFIRLLAPDTEALWWRQYQADGATWIDGAADLEHFRAGYVGEGGFWIDGRPFIEGVEFNIEHAAEIFIGGSCEAENGLYITGSGSITLAGAAEINFIVDYHWCTEEEAERGYGPYIYPDPPNGLPGTPRKFGSVILGSKGHWQQTNPEPPPYLYGYVYDRDDPESEHFDSLTKVPQCVADGPIIIWEPYVTGDGGFILDGAATISDVIMSCIGSGFIRIYGVGPIVFQAAAGTVEPEVVIDGPIISGAVESDYGRWPEVVIDGPVVTSTGINHLIEWSYSSTGFAKLTGSADVSIVNIEEYEATGGIIFDGYGGITLLEYEGSGSFFIVGPDWDLFYVSWLRVQGKEELYLAGSADIDANITGWGENQEVRALFLASD
jgi:hypothetical protein